MCNAQLLGQRWKHLPFHLLMSLLSFLSDEVVGGLSPPLTPCMSLYIALFFFERSLIEPGPHQLPRLAGWLVSSSPASAPCTILE